MSNNRGLVRGLILASLFAVPSVFAAENAASQEMGGYGLHYFKQWKAMTLDTGRIAVKAAGEKEIFEALTAAKIDVRAAQQHTLPGWWLVNVPADMTIESAVAAVAAQASVEFAAPMFIGEYGPNWPTRDLIVGFEPGTPVQQRDALLTAANVLGGTGKLIDREWNGMVGVDHLSSSSKNGFDVMMQSNVLAELPVAVFAEPDMVISGTTFLTPNDPFYTQQWGLNNTGQSGGVADMDMNAPEAWDITTGSSSIVVVVIDSGIELTHPDLNLGPSHTDWTGQGTGGAPFNSCDNHGTAVAGCISGRINNSIGGTGIAPGCRVASARPFVPNNPCDGGWTSQAAWTVNAVNWAQTIGARVTNNSNGYGFTSAAIDTAYTNTYNAGIVHFASNGNGGGGSIAYPASSASVRGVGAIDRTGVRASFSQFGTGTYFAAPGVTILSTDRTGNAGYVAGDYVNVDGTSFSSPYTAGVAALILSRNPSSTPGQTIAVMALTAKDRGAAGYDTVYGYGIPNAYAALLTTLAGPSNDFCASAINVSGQGTFNGTLQNATFASADGGASCGSSGTNPDVWYTFTAPAGVAGVLTASTCGTHDTGGVDAGIDTVLAVFDSCGGTQLACNDDTTACGALDTSVLRDSLTTTPLTAGQTVKIRVSKFGSGATAAGTFTLNIGFAPVNDACSAAIDISAAAASAAGLNTTGTLVGATNDGTALCGSSGTNADVWYRFTAPASACGARRLIVTTCGTHDQGGVNTGMDTVLSLHTACGQNSVVCNDDAAASGPYSCAGLDSGVLRDSVVTRDMNPGETIFIRVSKFSTVPAGPFQLHATFVPINNECADAQPVTNGTYNFCTNNATTDGPNEAGVCSNAGDTNVGSDVWFRYTATCTNTVTVSLCGSNFDTKVGVYGGVCPTSPGSVIACNDDACGLQSITTFPATSGVQYLVRVGGYNGARGSVTMNLSCAGGCGTADFDGDGDIGTDADIEAFFACLGGNCCATCFPGGADFNGDGDIGTDADIEAFFRVLGGGNC